MNSFKTISHDENLNWALNENQLAALETFKSKLKQNVYKFEHVHSLCGVQTNTPESILLSCKDRYGLPVNTWLSLRSGLLWTSPRMDSESLKRFYAEDYRAIYSQKGNPDVSFYCTQAQRGIAAASWLKNNANFSIEKGGVVFDIGCGAGGVLEVFNDFGWKTFGCDYDESYLDYGRKKGLELKSGGIEALKVFGKADLIIVSHVLEHIFDPIHFMRDLKKYLSPNGIVFITLPGIFNLAPYNWQFIRFLQNAHLHHFSANTLKTLASISGLRVIASDETIRMALSIDDSMSPIKWNSVEADNILKYLNSPVSPLELIGQKINSLLCKFGLKINRIKK